MPFGMIEQAIADIRAGKLVIVADDEERENEGDLVGAAELVTPEMINFMATHGARAHLHAAPARALPGAGAPADGRAEHRGARDRVHGERRRRGALRRHHRHLRGRSRRHDPRGDRSRDGAAATCGAPATSSRCARARAACCSAWARPRRAWTWRGSPGSIPAGVICEILNADGTMARRPELERFAAEHGLTFITVAQLVALPARARAAGAPRWPRRGCRRRIGEFRDHRLPQRRGRGRARGAGVRRRARRAERAGADALQVPHRRRVRLGALRLRLAAARARCG